MNRRNFLKQSLAGTTITMVASTGLLRSTTVFATVWPFNAFQASTVPQVLDQLFGTGQATQSSAVTLVVPMQSNGRSVPISVTSQLKDIESMAIMVEENACPLATLVRTPEAGDFYSCYIRMLKTSAVTAYVYAGGKLYSNSATVKINVGGYGMHGELAGTNKNERPTYVTKLRSRRKSDGKTEILALINHPMADDIPRASSTDCFRGQYIETLTFYHNGTLAAEATLGPWVAKNPLTGITLPNAKVGDTIKVSWVDNKGQQGGAQIKVS